MEKKKFPRRKTPKYYKPLASFATHGHVNAGTKNVWQSTVGRGVCPTIPYPKVKVYNKKGSLIHPASSA